MNSSSGNRSRIVIRDASWNSGGSFNLSGVANAPAEVMIQEGGLLDHSKPQRVSANSYATVIVEGEGSLLKANQFAMQNSFAKLIVREGGRATASWCFWLGRGGASKSNEVAVLDGGSARGPVWFGYNNENPGWPSSNNTVRVSNGTLEITGFPFNLRDECNLVLQGTNTVVTTQGAMRVFRGGRLIFYPPVAQSLAQVPLQVNGAISQIDADCKLIVDEAAALACSKAGGGEFTLVTMKNDTAAQFAIVEAPIYVTVQQNPRSIVVNVEDASFTRIFIR